MKFTDRSIESLKPKSSRYIEWKDNGEGMGLRVSPKGRKSFVYMYRFGGTARMMTLGDYPRMGLAAANRARSEAAELLERGIDPGAKLVAHKKAERAAETVQELADEYIEKYAKPRKRTWKKDDLILKKDVLPAWGKRKAKEITRRDVVLLLDTVLDRGAEIQANRTLAAIRKMFNFALGRSIVEFNPCAGIAAPSPERQRNRMLAEKEIRTVWMTLDTLPITEAARAATRLILLTAQRPGEVASAHWQDIDLDTGWWTIPAERAKNKLPHRVALSKLALDLLQARNDIAEDEAVYVFPAPRKAGCHMDVSVIERALKENMETFGIEKFVPHDLRRTAASHMTGMGISRLVVSKILNHVESGITAVYDRHSYDAEKRNALDSWALKLQKIVTGKENKGMNVIRIRTK